MEEDSWLEFLNEQVIDGEKFSMWEGFISWMISLGFTLLTMGVGVLIIGSIAVLLDLPDGRLGILPAVFIMLILIIIVGFMGYKARIYFYKLRGWDLINEDKLDKNISLKINQKDNELMINEIKQSLKMNNKLHVRLNRTHYIEDKMFVYKIINKVDVKPTDSGGTHSITKRFGHINFRMLDREIFRKIKY